MVVGVCVHSPIYFGELRDSMLTFQFGTYALQSSEGEDSLSMIVSSIWKF